MFSTKKLLDIRVLSIFLMSLLFLVAFFHYGAKAGAITQESRFLNAATWRLEELQFTAEDVEAGFLDTNDLRALTPDDTEEAGLIELNSRLREWTPVDFIDVGPTDPTVEYVTSSGIGCGNASKLERVGDNWFLTALSIQDGQNDCENIMVSSFSASGPVLFTNSEEDDYWRSIFARFADESTIVFISGASEGEELLFKASNTAFPDRYFLSETGIEFLDGAYIDIVGGPDGNGVYDATTSGLGGNSNIKVAGPESVANLNPVGESAEVERDSCEEVGGSFSWVFCPALELATVVIEDIDEAIINALEVNEEYYSGAEIRSAWSSIRDISYILLIPAVLIIVISTALGFQVVDAYTVKRAMPRLFFAVVFMALSFDLLVFLIEFTNNIGVGVGNIVAAPFGGKDALELQDIFSFQESLVVTGATGLGLAAVLFLVVANPASLLIILSYAAGAALFMIIVFSLLTLREMIIIFLIVFAPLAILFWIFPGMDKTWKLWWSTFSKLLLLFPIIVALLWIGRGFAKIIFVADAEGVESVFLFFAKFIAYIGPFFFIPAAFKYIGGVFANLSGMVNDRSKGLFDRNKKFRANQYKKRGKELRDGTFIKNGLGKSSFGKNKGKSRKDYFQKRLEQAANIDKAFQGGVSLRNIRGDMAANLQLGLDSHVTHEVDEVIKNDDFKLRALNDDESGVNLDVMSQNWENLRLDLTKKRQYKGDASAAVSEVQKIFESGDEAGALRRYYEYADGATGAGVGDAIFKGSAGERDKAVKAHDFNRRNFNEHALSRAYHEMAVKGGTYYQDEYAAWGTAEKITHGDTNAYANLSARVRPAGLNAGRADTHGISFGASFGVKDLIEQAKARGASEQEIREEVHQFISDKVIEQNAAGTLTHASMKTDYVADNTMSRMADRVDDAAYEMHDLESRGASQEEVVQAKEVYMKELAAMDNMQQSLLQSKPEMGPKVANILDRKVTYTKRVVVGTEVKEDLNGKKYESPVYEDRVVTETAREAKEYFKNDPMYQRYHKEFNAAEDIEARRAAGGRPPDSPVGDPSGGPNVSL